MDETTIVDTEKVSVSKLDTGIGSIWVADYVNRSKTYLPKLLDAGSPEYKERASENARLLDKYVISELSLALNKGLTVSGPATETTAMQSYQDDIRCKTNIEKDRTGAVLFDVFSKNWELISREGPAFQLPLDEAMNDPVNPGLPATCFIDFTIDEMTYQDRPMMIAFKDLWIKKRGQFIPRRVFDNHRFLKIIAGRKRYIPPTEIPLDDPSFTDYTIDEKSFMDKPTLHKIKCDALKRRKCLLTRWSGEHLTKDKHAWHIDHFKQFVAAHEANVAKMQSLSPIGKSTPNKLNSTKNTVMRF